MKQYKYESNPLPITEEVSQMYEYTHEYMESQGFEHYEVSNYAKGKEFRSKHNMMYWEGD